MKYYKNVKGKVYSFENEQEYKEWGAPDLVVMSPAEVEDHLNPQPTPIVPQVVTMRQARLALLSIGLLDQVEPAIDAMDEPARTIAKIEWDYSSEVHRDKPFVNSLGEILGLDGESIDALFAAAALID